MSDESDELAQVIDAAVTAQMLSIAAYHTVREILVDVAKLHADPDRYVTGLYDRVVTRLDPRPDLPEKFAVGQAREMVGAIFRDALHAVRNTPPEAPPGDAPP